MKEKTTDNETNGTTPSKTEVKIPKKKGRKPQTNHYIDDVRLTKDLRREQKEFKEGLRTKSSNELAKDFIMVLEHVLTKHNFSGYTKNYKDEFRSKAYELFVKHWHKFDPLRARLNYYQKDNVLYLKEDEAEWRGGFGWFSLFSKTAAVDEIKKFKKRREVIKTILDEKNAELTQIDDFLYK